MTLHSDITFGHHAVHTHHLTNTACQIREKKLPPDNGSWWNSKPDYMSIPSQLNHCLPNESQETRFCWNFTANKCP